MERFFALRGLPEAVQEVEEGDPDDRVQETGDALPKDSVIVEDQDARLGHGY